VSEQLYGHRIYWSLTGAANSWVVAGNATLPATAGSTSNVVFTLSLTNWEAGATLYLVWADDNGNNGFGTADGDYTMDDISFTPTLAAPPLVVSMSEPGNGASFQAPVDIQLAATVVAGEGSPAPSNVQFYANSTLVGAKATAPYTASWSNAVAGIYQLRAVARNSYGSYTSAPVAVTVTNLWAGTYTLLNTEQLWKYLDDGSDPGPGWVGPGYNDSGWLVGEQVLGYGDSPAETTVRSNRTDGSRILSTYFRVAFPVDNPAAFSYLTATLTRNDGAVVYLNGTEVLRNNLPAGPVDAQTLALTNAPAAGEVIAVNWPASFFLAGTNVVAVEMHLSDPTNNDMRFGLMLDAIVTNAPPSVSVLSPPDGVIYILAAPTNLPIVVVANDVDGTVAKVEFFLSGEKLGEATNAPYSLVWSNAFRNGTYYLTAVATDHLGLSTTSAPVSVTLICNVPPSVSLTNPANNTLLYGPTNLLLETVVVESGGLVTNVAFYAGVTKLGDVTRSPYSLAWSNVALGYYQLRAVATDNGGLSSTSAVVNISVLNPVVTLTSPLSGSRFVAPVNIDVAAQASGGAITNVGLYVNGGKLATDADPPYAWTLNNPPLGNYILTAVALDSGGGPNTSAPVNIAVVANIAPVVSLAVATNRVVAPANVQLIATASDADGSVVKVEFYQGLTKLGEDTASPYAFTWTNPPVGNYALYAVVTDNLGGTNRSADLAVTVANANVTRGPYLQMGTPTSMIVRWRTDASTDSRVRYGRSADQLDFYVDDETETTEHIVTLTGLQADTLYYYTIGNSAVELARGADYSLVTAPTGAKPTRVWVIGDAGTTPYGTTQAANQRAVRDAYYAYAGARRTDVWLQLGDNAYPAGTDAQFQQAVFDVYPTLLRQTVTWPTIGNHETDQAHTIANFPQLDNFSLPASGEAGGVASGTERYYSFEYGNIHFVCLDSMTSDRSSNGVMCAWLQEDLAANTKEWVIAYWHHPPYTKGSHNSDNTGSDYELVEMRQNVVPILESYGVDLVLSGHSHSYERSYLMNGHYGMSTTFSWTNQVDAGSGRPGGTGPYLKDPNSPFGNRGVVYAVAGSSGQTSGGNLNHPAMFVAWNQLGSMVLDINGSRLDAIFLRDNRTTNDSFTILKGASQAAPPAAPAGLVAVSNAPDAVRLSWANNATNEVSYSLEVSVNGADFSEVAAVGANLTSYTNTGLSLVSNAYYYRLRAWNNAGSSAYSTLAGVTPSGPLAIDRQPADTTVPEGGTASLFVLARGSGTLNYKWYRGAILLSGQTNSALTLSNVQSTDAGYYAVVISNGGTPITSTAALLAVTGGAVPPEVVGQPQLTNGTFVTAFQGSPGLTYTIQSKNTLEGTWQNLTNITVPPGGIISLQERVSGLPQRFYRAVYPAR
jgi:hypothetical protein